MSSVSIREVKRRRKRSQRTTATRYEQCRPETWERDSSLRRPPACFRITSRRPRKLPRLPRRERRERPRGNL